jgi:RNA polymerase sigma-70 factor (ECF subfamily)
MVGRVVAGHRHGAREVVSSFDTLGSDDRRLLLDELAAAASAGNKSALRALIELIDHHQLAHAAIRRVVVSNDDIEEAHQDVLLAVAQSIDRFRGDAAFTTWLFAIGRNSAAALVRRAQRVPSPAEDVDQPITGQQLSSMIASRSDLRTAIEDLPDHYRHAVELRDVRQLPYDEIARQLDVPVNTVKSRLNRGRALVAAAVAEAR